MMRARTKNEILEKAKKMKDELEQNKRKIPVFIYEPLQKLIRMATDETQRFYEVMQSFYKEFVTIVEAGQEWMNAFLCGFINGFLDFISGIFSFIGFFLKAVKNYADYKQNETFYHTIVLEYSENFIQAMASFDCIAFFKQVLSLPLEMLSKFITLAKSINITFNGSKIAYFTGYIIFAIVQIVLEIIFTGGSATVERLFAKAGSSVKNVLKKAGNLVDDVFEALSHLIDQIKKGANNFAAYVKKIIDDFFKWLEDLFKSGKADEVFDDVQKGIRKATKQDIDELAKVRKFFSAGKKKNVAFTKGEIGGKKIELWSRSGGEKGQKFDNFKSIKPENYHYKGPISDYIHHTEQKQIEYLYQLFKNNKKVNGKIEVVSELKICDNCSDIISSFQKDFPNIEITRIWVREVLD